MDSLLQDLRYAVRMLWASPGFAVIAILTLGFGIGANTAVFSVINGVLLRPLPYPDQDRLVVMKNQQSRMDMEDVRERTQTLELGGAYNTMALDYTGGAEPMRLISASSDVGLLPILGARPLLGRIFTGEDDTIGASRTVVLSHSFWQQNLGGAADILGKTIPLGGQDYAVIGVLPPAFSLPNTTVDLFVMLRSSYPEAAKYRGVHFMRSFWRLRPGVTLSQAQGEMESIDRALAQQFPAEDKERHTVLTPMKEWLVSDSRPALLVLFGAVGFVLLVACANFGNLLLARVLARRPEMTVRAALGASRARIVRQVLTESLLLSLLGSLAGYLLARLGVTVLLSLKPVNLPRLHSVVMDWRVFLFAVSAAVFTGVAFGLAPAWASAEHDGIETLKEASPGLSAGVGARRLRRALVAGEIALALLLLAGTGLLVKAFWRLHTVDPGFTPENLLTLDMNLPAMRYSDTRKQNEFRRTVLDGLNRLPDVQAAMIGEVPMGGDFVYHNFAIEGRSPLPQGNEPELQSRSVMGEYFQVMHIPITVGRALTSEDREDSVPVGVINKAMAQKYFPSENPIGARVRWARTPGPPHWITIVGVAGDVKHFGLDQPDEPAIYTPYEQIYKQPWKRWMSLVVRSRRDPSSLLQDTKQVVWSVDKQIPMGKVQTMTELLSASVSERKFNMLLMALFSGLGLALAAVGIYGLMTHSATQRTHEIGIRMALGATRANIMKLMLGECAILLGLGLTAGLAAAFGLTRLMGSMLFEVRPTDPATFAAVSIILAAVALLASYLPSRRATHIDPLQALRYE
jgi:putative ABC transport system permease protein